jgi:hypothetical protein
LCPNRYPREQLLKNILTNSSVIETIIPSDGIPITQGRIDLMDSKEGGSSKDDWYQKVRSVVLYFVFCLFVLSFVIIYCLTLTFLSLSLSLSL